MVKKRFKSRLFLSVVLSFVMAIALLNGISVTAEDVDERYPYTIFAGSDEEGAISIDADNFCVNGNVAVNGTMVSTGNVNINGTKTEQVGESMIYILNKIDTEYFSDSNVEMHNEDYLLEELNINIGSPLAVEGDTTLIGNINLSSAL